MGTKLSTYWRSETVKPADSDSDNSSGLENEPTCDPKSIVNGHSNDSGDEDTQQDQDGGNLDGKNDNESDDTHLSTGLSNTKDNFNQEECIISSNGADDDEELESKNLEANYKNGSNGNGVDDESCNEAIENGTNGESNIPIILLNDIFSQEHSSSPAQLGDSRNDFTSTNPAEQARITYAAVARNNNKVLIGTHQRQSQLTLESRKREHSPASDRSTPNYQHAYLNDLPIANRSKKAKSSETDSVSSSRSDRASTEIEQITPKVAKSRKRRAKPAKKYLS